MFSKKGFLLFVLISAIILQFGCCSRKKVPGETKKNSASNSTGSDGKNDKAGVGSARSAVDSPHDVLSETGLNYSLDGGRTPGLKNKGSSFFETKYLEGIKLMESGEFSKAVSVFENITQRYPDTEESSVAELCIAELYFRNKSNHLALEKYKSIVEKYPNSHAAENARAGIRYLEDFEKYEQEHIPSDVEDRKRRGF
jgi:TolA-binding protein